MVELVVRRDRLTHPATKRERFENSAESLAQFNDVYRQSNDPRLATAEVESVGGKFSATLLAPASARGACHVRIFMRRR